MNKLLSLLLFLFYSCYVTMPNLLYNQGNINKITKLSDSNLQSWQHKDPILDSIPGISLERAYQELIKGKIGSSILIAVIDTQIDLEHEEYSERVWKNINEIANNKIDDDHNGYIDDVNGWNFLGNVDGESIIWENAVFTRIVKKYQQQFKGKSIDSISDDIKHLFIKYQNAKKRLVKEKTKRIRWEKNLKRKLNIYNGIVKDIEPYFSDKEFTIEKLLLFKTKDSVLQKRIDKMIYSIKKGYSGESFKFQLDGIELDTRFWLNLNYNDRLLIGDNIEDITDTHYGYHNVNISQDHIFYHGTYIAGLIVANRHNNKGIKGVAPSNTKIMPIVVACEGDEYDKDIALAIRYAVDMGANIINMSFKKDFEMHNEWVVNAIKYAEKNNVLLVKAAGNDNQNLDFFEKNGDYPNDYDTQGKEYVNNFLNIGASTHYLNKNIKADFSNYGKKNIDIFAPGAKIYTTSPLNKYRFKSGTSLSTPIVSGIAALVWSHYPNLKAHEIKEIIMESGVSYDIDVEITNEKGEKVELPFNSLSKSGKIVNAYNALLMAKNYKKWKKGKWPKK